MRFIFTILSFLVLSAPAFAEEITRISKVKIWSKLLTIEGKVTALRGDEIRVTDRSGSLWVDVGPGYHSMGIKDGSYVRVFGERDANEFDAYQIMVGDSRPYKLKDHYLYDFKPIPNRPKVPSKE